MARRVVAVMTWLGLIAGALTAAAAQESTSERPAEGATSARPARSKLEKATFAGGCFWSMETVFERVPGVKSVVSGFSGGSVLNPSYEMVGTGATGHAESIQVVYDASVVSYDDLLKLFFRAHDPTTLNAQGDDFGPQYRSVIFFHNDDQRQAALAMYKELTRRKVFRHPIVTELVPFQAFWPAEAYHQDYYANHRDSFYSQFYIEPKLKKLHLAPTAAPRTARTGK